MLVVIVALDSELSSKRLPAGVELVRSGVGKINAALATADAIARFNPVLVVNYGTAGRVSGTASGLLEVASVLQRDMLAEPLAPRGVTPFDAGAAVLGSGRTGIVCGTGDSFVMATDPWLVAKQVDVVDMELYAIAAACVRRGVKWRALKFVTDAADESAAEEWQARVGDGESLFVEQLQKILKEPGA